MAISLGTRVARGADVGFDFSGDVVLFIGAGAHVHAPAFARAGASVVPAGAGDAGRIDAVAVDCGPANDKAVRRLIDTVLNRFGKIDVLVATAGAAAGSGPLDLSEDRWDRLVDAGLRPLLTAARHVAGPMIADGGGRIVLTAATLGSAGAAHAVSAEHRLAEVTRALAGELAPYNVTVNGICPVGQPGPDPYDIAQAAMWLASDAARAITGSVLRIDGDLAPDA